MWYRSAIDGSMDLTVYVAGMGQTLRMWIDLKVVANADGIIEGVWDLLSLKGVSAGANIEVKSNRLKTGPNSTQTSRPDN
jgi:hypothetical protein